MEQESFSQRLKLWSIVILVYVISLFVVGAGGFFPVIFLAGPHSDVLPDFLNPVVAFLYVFAMLILPVWAAIKVKQKLYKKPADRKGNDPE
ncbi:MAG: hypothetical protein L0Y80_00315 [Ignavibacteriae bacterium]|nr:hypothetical protein [Ignavibacteriota bacterium]